MEDFGTIIWLVAIVGAMLVSANSKARKKAQEAAKKAIRQLEEEGQRHEAWPSWDTPERHPTAAADETTRQTPAYTPIYPQTETDKADGEADEMEQTPISGYEAGQTPISGYETAARKTAGTKRSAQPAKTAAVSAATAVKASRTDPSDEGFAAEIREEFDLRRAVVYSEILKPKFDEYE